MAKIVIIGFVLIVLFCLFRALYIMVVSKGDDKGDGVANFLTLRVTFSAILIGFLVLANHQGWIQFHGPYQDPRLVQQMEQARAADENKATID